MITIKKGDITQENVDVIVNAANTGLKGGGGVDGAIHSAAGAKVLQECRTLGGCKTGEAKITNAGNLKAKKIIHAVGPVWSGGHRNEANLLRDCYVNSLKLAKQNHLKTIAFPAISTGVYRFPKEEATIIAISAVWEYREDFNEIRFICFSDEDESLYNQVWREKFEK